MLQSFLIMIVSLSFDSLYYGFGIGIERGEKVSLRVPIEIGQYWEEKNMFLGGFLVLSGNSSLLAVKGDIKTNTGILLSPYIGINRGFVLGVGVSCPIKDNLYLSANLEFVNTPKNPVFSLNVIYYGFYQIKRSHPPKRYSLKLFSNREGVVYRIFKDGSFIEQVSGDTVVKLQEGKYTVKAISPDGDILTEEVELHKDRELYFEFPPSQSKHKVKLGIIRNGARIKGRFYYRGASNSFKSIHGNNIFLPNGKYTFMAKFKCNGKYTFKDTTIVIVSDTSIIFEMPPCIAPPKVVLLPEEDECGLKEGELHLKVSDPDSVILKINDGCPGILGIRVTIHYENNECLCDLGDFPPSKELRKRKLSDCLKDCPNMLPEGIVGKSIGLSWLSQSVMR